MTYFLVKMKFIKLVKQFVNYIKKKKANGMQRLCLSFYVR